MMMFAWLYKFGLQNRVRNLLCDTQNQDDKQIVEPDSKITFCGSVKV